MSKHGPDSREEYPNHGQRKQCSFVTESLTVPFYPCRTYDRDGKLINEEIREPSYLNSAHGCLKAFDIYYQGEA
mgnify:CR=1 FL=1|jgi:hypothetical protein